MVDRVKWRRDQDERIRDTRRSVYVEFLGALHRARESHWRLAGGTVPDGRSREAAAREVLHESQVWHAGERLLISAPQSVVDAVDRVVERLRSVRDVVAAGASSNSAEFEEAEKAYAMALVTLRATMREDLGVEPIAMTT
ncbi:hypothetical protein [Sphaerisporangium dianthi]|uniref:SAV-6107-like HEPN domain-containing protein n=1 Tax=Sphaerisporangium dianthi TaxID=1436120 RepID=A0ABV9CK27_9ACTN